MRNVISFMVTTLDGYVEGPNGEFDWPNVDDEFNDFAIKQLADIDTLLFGRVGYEGMASYWPTDQAQRDDPDVAGLMNGVAKVVYSKTLDKADWSNTTLVQDDAATDVEQRKQQSGKTMGIFGSPNLAVSLMRAGLVDELRVMVMPILLGAGRSLYDALDGERVAVQHVDTRTFASGNVIITYRPVIEGGPS
ncbi:MAG TPA: dihydrofolate reductase family protein [Acidimicrobiales bacterium]|jgi:dihydrofolate reductase|nr:dihydrofolate reductase family protein [Acidimicrobiales bacterium]